MKKKPFDIKPTYYSILPQEVFYLYTCLSVCDVHNLNIVEMDADFNTIILY